MATASTPERLLIDALEWVERHGSPHLAVKNGGCTIPVATLRDRVHKAKALGLVVGNKVTSGDDLELRRQIKSLQSELARAQERAVTEEAIRRKIIGLTEAVTIYQPPAWAAEPAKKHSSPGVPTLFCSDWHTGEVVNPAQINYVNEFNMAIMRERVHTLVESAIDLLRILSPKMEYPGIVCPLGGDMISGNIHDELMATNELNTMPTVLELFGILVGMILRLADVFGKVFLPCVGGNHGRDTKKIWNKDRNATSFDWLLYSFLAKRFEDDKRVTFLIPDGPDALYKIYDHRYLLTHGDQFRGGDSMIGALGPITRGDHKKRSRNAQIDMSYDTMILGHWHQYIHLNRMIVNGSLKGYDEYAYSNGFSFEPPQQALWITHPERRMTFRVPVYLDKKRTAKKTDWVSIAR